MSHLPTSIHHHHHHLLLPLLLLLFFTSSPTSATPPGNWPQQSFRKLTDINLQPFSDPSCTGIHLPHDPNPHNPNVSTHAEIYLRETWRDAGTCHALAEGAWFQSFSFRYGTLRGGPRYKPNQGSRLGYDEEIGMCVIEIYADRHCGLRQTHLIKDWGWERPVYVVLNATSEENGFVHTCHHVTDLSRSKGRSIFFDCRRRWWEDFWQAHLP
ncbi:hypothetical protein CERZMDRAFT_100000 [Cercospora zeae-maydis SCOH1-5]|uniref:Uncharacterized protein n=1 Tax=Cercospora zeae-maydis SCOH1-5 TaxID=717836 RepID=A0A6A6F983_9PEZI|nr:hypothetical protein CERZMDRAFT_100000 [Cercospora zeae-maydis SCOH1-5]